MNISTLSKFERQLFINQFTILKILDKENAQDYELKIKILENGFVNNYDQIITCELNEISADDCNFVDDVLSFYDSLECFKKQHHDLIQNDDELQKKIDNIHSFIGFDCNDAKEGKLSSYADFILNIEKKYKAIFGILPEINKDCNSHLPMLEEYSILIDKWKNLGKPHSLTIEFFDNF
jgi:uncharacterized protein YfbU (UPF0304 family)